MVIYATSRGLDRSNPSTRVDRSEILTCPGQIDKLNFREHIQSAEIRLVCGFVKFVPAVVYSAGTNFTKPCASLFSELCTKMQPLFWCKQEVWTNVMCHPVFMESVACPVLAVCNPASFC